MTPPELPLNPDLVSLNPDLVPLNTVSLRRRVTAAVIAVLTLVLLLLGITVNALFVLQSNRNLDALLTGRAQLARQLARNGVGPQQIVNRVEADGVRAHLVLRNGSELGSPVPVGNQIKTTTVMLNQPGRANNAQLTLAVDTSLVAGAHATLRRVLLIAGAAALLASGLLVAAAVNLALRPLNAMAGLARTIAGGNRGARLRPTRIDTEIGQTAAAFDEMLDELEGAEARARQAEERTRSFLSDAAHELRTPIAGVQAAAETLLHHGDQLDLDSRQHLQALLVREAQRAGALVTDLLAAARLDAGVDLQLQPVSLGALTGAEVERARLLFPGATITRSGPEVTAYADPAKVVGILRNLVDNALRSAGPTGELHLITRTQPDSVVLEVWDNGGGVPPADRERIFERLVRLDSSRSADSGGSGLGLAIARGYARAHGGDLTCDDPHGPGAVFRLTLPLAASPPPGPHPLLPLALPVPESGDR